MEDKIACERFLLLRLFKPVQKILGLTNVLVTPKTILESNIFPISNTRKKDGTNIGP